jgi:phosphatidylinositol alpha-1,6-mannosyltransferase
MVGRMMSSERYKGHQEVLAALRRLAVRRPDARLVITGDGNDRRRLEVRAGELGLAPQVVFTGFVSEQTLQQLYQRCAAMVLPSRGEGFGLVYLEAMRAKKPCVAARGSAAEEIVLPEVTGVLVDPDDSAEVAAALERLLADPEAAGRMGQAGHRRWAEVFDLSRFRARLWPHLDRLVEASDVRD